MTLDEIIFARAILQDAIENLIKQFNQETGAKVATLKVIYSYNVSGTQTGLEIETLGCSVKADIEL